MCTCVCTYMYNVRVHLNALLTTPKLITKGKVYKHTLTYSHTCTLPTAPSAVGLSAPQQQPPPKGKGGGRRGGGKEGERDR